LHSLDPGPKYNISLDMSRPSLVTPNTPRLKIPKAKNTTFIEEAVMKNKHVPGVGRYEVNKK